MSRIQERSLKRALDLSAEHMPRRQMRDSLFVRYGGLAPVKQAYFKRAVREARAQDGMASFHSPPAKRGIYSFPFKYVEPFLLGATCSNLSKPGPMMQRLRIDGKALKWDDHAWESYDEKFRRQVGVSTAVSRRLKEIGYRPRDLVKLKDDTVGIMLRPRVYSHTGKIWHHLEEYVSEDAIQKRTGSWVLTDFDTWKSALKDSRHNSLQQSHGFEGCFRDLAQRGELSYDPFRGANPGVSISMDHLEVFIERPGKSN